MHNLQKPKTFLMQDLHELSYASSAVVQRYIGNPLLVGGYKCDVRLYVLVTSFLPLTVYVYTEGIVRWVVVKRGATLKKVPFKRGNIR